VTAAPAKQRPRRARPWHRILGALTVLPLAWVTITGWLLNHTVDWRLDQRQIDHPWILEAYGMTPSGKASGLLVENHSIMEWDGQIFLNDKPLDVRGKLIGAVLDRQGLAVVTESAVLRVSRSGEVVETLDELALPETPLLACATHDGSVLLKNAEGWHEASEDWLEFHLRPEADFPTAPLTPVEDPDALKPLRRTWAQGGLPVSRVVLDLHAGRFLGPFANYFYDFVSLCTMILCVTGVILFFRTSRRTR